MEYKIVKKCPKSVFDFRCEIVIIIKLRLLQQLAFVQYKFLIDISPSQIGNKD